MVYKLRMWTIGTIGVLALSKSNSKVDSTSYYRESIPCINNNKMKLRFVTYYPLYVDSLRIGVRNLTRQYYHLSRLLLQFLSYKFHLLYDQLTYSNSKEHMSNFHKRKCYDYSLLDHTSFRSPQGKHCLNPMRYHGASSENTYCYQPLPIVTQSIGIYDHLRISPIGQSLLLTLV